MLSSQLIMFILGAELKSQTIGSVHFFGHTHNRFMSIMHERHHLNHLFKDPSVGIERRITEPSRAEPSGA